MIRRPLQAGFTLMEIAIVLLIVMIVLGYTVAMFPMQQELKQYRAAGAQMDLIIEELIAFAQVNGRLPCPDTNGDAHGSTITGDIDGQEDRHGSDACKAYHGFLPAATLGIDGRYNDDNQLLDPWLSPYRYAVSHSNANVSGSNSNLDFVTTNGIRDEGISAAANEASLYICDDSAAAGDDTDCDDVTGDQVIGEVAAVVISLGKDFSNSGGSATQAENVDDFHDGLNDDVYIFTARRDDYDDIVRWVSTNLLISRMIAADQLP